jgi:hypothetical protein
MTVYGNYFTQRADTGTSPFIPTIEVTIVMICSMNLPDISLSLFNATLRRSKSLFGIFSHGYGFEAM